MSEEFDVVPDTYHDVFVRNTSLGWPSGPESGWAVWCAGRQLCSSPDRATAITKARTEAAVRSVRAWLGEPNVGAARL